MSRTEGHELEALNAAIVTIGAEAQALRRCLDTLVSQVAAARARAQDLLAAHGRDAGERAGLARIGGARVLADALEVEGRAAVRAGIRRLRVGDAIERPFAPWQGITRVTNSAADVVAHWQQLLAREAGSADGMLRGAQSTILDVPRTRLSAPTRVLQVLTGAAGAPADHPVVAVPRFAHATPPRKLRNFSHWLLDCLPQVAVLMRVAPGAPVLLPHPLRDVHRWTLAMAGVSAGQIVPWAGDPVTADRALVFESDGRPGGGRPLSSLLSLRRATLPPGASPGVRRIYVSRRDAKKHRRWATNESAVEALFASRGFDIVCPTSHSADELVTCFRDAAVVAGLNGAGLAHVFFSAPGTHVIVLLTDSLVRWYADAGGARSLWASHHHAGAGELAALGDSPRFYAHVAAAFEQYCHSFVSADEIPIDALAVFLDEALRKVERG